MFGDAVGEMCDVVLAKGGKLYGETSQDGYSYSDSKALRNGKGDMFCGLFFDENHEHYLSEGRAKA